MAEQVQRWETAEGGENPRSDAKPIVAKVRALRTGLEREPGDSILSLCVARGERAQRSGLVLPSRLSFGEWRQIGSQLFLVANSSAWWVGDWLVYGENSFEDRYEQALADTSLDYQTLRNYAWVAKKFTMSRRRDRLSFGHHAEVAAFTEAEQDVWLTRAEKFSWSRNELRRRIHVTRLANRPQSLQEAGTKTKIVKIDVEAERLDLWQQAAERMNCSVAEWITTTLDTAATPES